MGATIKNVTLLVHLTGVNLCQQFTSMTPPAAVVVKNWLLQRNFELVEGEAFAAVCTSNH